jgi:hypothetical protein
MFQVFRDCRELLIRQAKDLTIFRLFKHNA